MSTDLEARGSSTNRLVPSSTPMLQNQTEKNPKQQNTTISLLWLGFAIVAFFVVAFIVILYPVSWMAMKIFDANNWTDRLTFWFRLCCFQITLLCITSRFDNFEFKVLETSQNQNNRCVKAGKQIKAGIVIYFVGVLSFFWCGIVGTQLTMQLCNWWNDFLMSLEGSILVSSAVMILLVLFWFFAIACAAALHYGVFLLGKNIVDTVCRSSPKKPCNEGAAKAKDKHDLLAPLL